MPQSDPIAVTDSPSGDLVAVTPHDTNPVVADGAAGQKSYTRGIYVGGAGNLAIVTRKGQTVVITGVLAGVFYPVQAYIIKSTSTTATNLVAMY